MQLWVFTLRIRCCPGSFSNAKLVAEFRRHWFSVAAPCPAAPLTCSA